MTQEMPKKMPDWVMIPEPPVSTKTDTIKWDKSAFEKMAAKGQVITVEPTSSWATVIESSAVEIVIKGSQKP